MLHNYEKITFDTEDFLVYNNNNSFIDNIKIDINLTCATDPFYFGKPIISTARQMHQINHGIYCSRKPYKQWKR